MKDFIREWSTLDKTSFPLQYDYKERTKTEARKVLDKSLFLTIEATPDFIYCLRKRIPETQIEKIKNDYIQKNPLPQNMDELYEGWGCLRIININRQTCDCSNFFKYGYCKHIIALKVMSKELDDPIIKPLKKPGRKPKMTKALQK